MTGEKTRILAVDNQPTSASLMKGILSQAGYEVIEALSGQEALEKMSLGGIDLVLLDVLMPGGCPERS